MLKNLARELNIPILCLAQLSRKVEERQGHRPMMSDLRESGCLTGDTLIKDATTGHLYTIKELAERTAQTPMQVFAVDENLKLGPHTMIKAFYSGRKIDSNSRCEAAVQSRHRQIIVSCKWMNGSASINLRPGLTSLFRELCIRNPVYLKKEWLH